MFWYVALRDPFNRGLKDLHRDFLLVMREVALRDPFNRGLKEEQTALLMTLIDSVALRDPFNRGLKDNIIIGVKYFVVCSIKRPV